MTASPHLRDLRDWDRFQTFVAFTSMLGASIAVIGFRHIDNKVTRVTSAGYRLTDSGPFIKDDIDYIFDTKIRLIIYDYTTGNTTGDSVIV